MQQDDSEEIKPFFFLKNLPSIFGPESFIRHIKEEFYSKKKSFEVPESKKLAPDADMIIQEVCEYYDVFLKRYVYNQKRMV